MKHALTLLLVWIAFANPALGWNGKGHMLIGRLAWRQLNDDQRTKVLTILAKHPHYEEYLKADRPDNIPEDEWVFLRAGTWSDWVRNGKQRSYHRSEWHYINLPVIPPGQRVNLPPIPKDTVVTRLAAARVIVKNGNQEDRAIYLCWLIHLVGDIHQPLHCTALYSVDFPTGDRGGNLALVRIEGRVVQLHSFWDNLLGSSATQSTLTKSEGEVAEARAEHEKELAADLRNHLTPKDWAQEGYRLAKRLVYQDGKLRPGNSDKKPDDESLPNLPRSYGEEAGAAARLCAAKAGDRLAVILREIVGE